MKKGTKLLLGGLTVAAAVAGAFGAVIMNSKPKRRRRDDSLDSWARPGMQVTFRAEVMPGRDAEARTFRVTDLLPSGRVRLDGAVGEHAQKEFVQR
jgi:hypothetical protein